MAGESQQVMIKIPPLDIRRMQIVLVGDSRLVVHAWSDKARKMMLDTQMKKAKAGKEAKDPERDYCDSLYWITKKPKGGKPTEAEWKKAKFGFPVIAFKAAAVDACSHVDGMTKVLARGAFHVGHSAHDSDELVEIQGTPSMREDMARVGMGKADIRYRAEFWPWRVILPIRYNASVLSAEQIVNLLNTAGFAVGVGEHRPQRDGQWGLFHVAADGE